MDRYTVEPSVGIYNLFNFTNFDLPPSVMTGLLNGNAQSVMHLRQGLKAAAFSANLTALNHAVQ